MINSPSVKRVCLFLIILFSFFVNDCYRNPISVSEEEAGFYNPIDDDGADPWVIEHEGFYYYCFSDNDTIYVSKSANLKDIAKVKSFAVWNAVEGTNYSDEIWAPELHYLQNKWYIYFAGDNGDNNNHRIYVLESTSNNATEPFILKGKINDNSDKWAIDGTVFNYKEKLYFIWSGWEGDINVQQNLYIAEMFNPWTISGDRVLISSPDLSWEKNGDPLINEGPEVLENKGNIFIIYSASGSWTDDYCLGMLKFRSGNVLNKSSWRKYPAPVFSRTDSVFGPGHASFVKSEDGSEHWIIYHAAKHKGSGWDRNVRIQPFKWIGDSIPDFGKPLPLSTKLRIPKK